jgi:hypothetical protein
MGIGLNTSSPLKRKAARALRISVWVSLSSVSQISSIILLVASALIVKIVSNPIDYKNIKNNIQAWIDSDTTNVDSKTKEDKKQADNEEASSEKEETPKGWRNWN